MKLITIVALMLFAVTASAGSVVLEEISAKIAASFDQETGTFAEGASETLLEAHSLIGAADLTDEHELIVLKSMNSLVTYNLTCLEALSGNNEEALVWLEEAVASGYSDPEWMLQDTDLATLKDNPRFLELVAAATENSLANAHDCTTCESRGNCDSAE